MLVELFGFWLFEISEVFGPAPFIEGKEQRALQIHQELERRKPGDFVAYPIQKV